MQVSTTFRTAGNSLYSKRVATVKIVDVRITYMNDEKDFGELCVYFDTKTWSTRNDGLIYTDTQFIADLREFLVQNSIAVDVSYSEAGMQGNGYVSFDVGADLLSTWEAKFGEVAL